MSEIGHNSPPVVTHAMHIDDLYDEAKRHLDGEPIATQDQAEAVATLLSSIREARKAADEQRVIEKRPHDEAAKAVQAAYAPLLAKCDLASGACKDALTPYQRKLEDEQRVKAQAAIEEAERLSNAALEAATAARQSGDLTARADAEEALKAAKGADKAASKLDKAKALVSGGGRAVGLVDVWTPELTDARAALLHYMAAQPEPLKAWLMEQAAADIRSGVRSIPGFTIKHDRVAR